MRRHAPCTMRQVADQSSPGCTSLPLLCYLLLPPCRSLSVESGRSSGQRLLRRPGDLAWPSLPSLTHCAASSAQRASQLPHLHSVRTCTYLSAFCRYSLRGGWHGAWNSIARPSPLRVSRWEVALKTTREWPGTKLQSDKVPMDPRNQQAGPPFSGISDLGNHNPHSPHQPRPA
jgi:hypothetical protein